VSRTDGGVIKAYRWICYVYCNQSYLLHYGLSCSQCERALASLSELEKIPARAGLGDPRSIGQTITYAKFVVQVKDQDWRLAEQNLRKLFVSGSYESCLEAVKTFLEAISSAAPKRLRGKDGRSMDVDRDLDGQSGLSKSLELFRLLLSKFPG
jgi:hypothetical protein